MSFSQTPFWSLADIPLGLALLAMFENQVSVLRRRWISAAATACLATVVVGLLWLMVFATPGSSASVWGEASGGMPKAAWQFAVLSLAVSGVFVLLLLGLVWRPRGWLAAAAGWVGAACALVFFVLAVGMLFQADARRWELLQPGGFISTTGSLAVALALVAAGRTSRLPLRVIWQDSNSAHLLRMFVPTTVAFVFLAELLSDLAGEFLVLEPGVVRAIRVLLPVVTLFVTGIVLTYQMGRRLDIAEASLVEARDELELRVAERTAALMRANKELQDEICSRVLAEAAQRESLANFRTLGDLVPAAVFLHRDGRCLYANQVAAELVGGSREELIGRELTDFVHPDFRTLVKDRSLRRQAGEDVPARYELALLARNGEARWVDASAQRILLRSEPAVMICALDVTERKQAEAKLAASEERFRQVVENIREVFWMTDPGKQEFLYLSKAYESIWGRAREAVFTLPKEWLESIHPEDRARVQGAMEKLRTTGRYEEIYRIVRPDGLVRWIQDRAFPIVNERGEVYRIAGIAEDITAWKATEESLRTSEERFRSLFEAAPIGVALLGAEGHYLRINRAYCEMLGYSEVELLRLGTKRVTHPEDVNRGQELHRELLSGARDHYAREKRLMTKEGRMIYALSATSAVRDATGKLRYIVSMLLDVTDRKRLQNEVLAISSLERRRIGHDLHDGLGQFLSGIAFKAKCLEEVLQTEAPAAEPAANELVRLLNSAVSQARTLARGLDPVEAEVGGLVPALHKLAAESAKLFSLDCSFESNVPELSLDNGVALHLFRIAQEAITNAARHGGARRITMQLSQGVEDIRLKIEDDGRGFVLDPRPPDVGLGLRTMQYRADTIGASLQIRSGPNEGTGVECVLPLEPGAPLPERIP